MKILVISNSEWDDGNSFGSTFSNIFSFVKPENIANIYCRNGFPNSKFCGNFFSMGESDILKFLLKSRDFQKVECNNKKIEIPTTGNNSYSKIKRFATRHRWIILFWLREILWGITPWKNSRNLDAFIKEFAPDIIVLPIYSMSYINKLALHISSKYTIPVVSYVSDDEYTLRQFHISPLWWINRLYQRIWVKKAIDKSLTLYVISSVQKNEYDKIFKRDCKILTKGAPPVLSYGFQIIGPKIKLVYVGNIGGGRFKTISMLSDCIKLYPNNFIFDIYTSTPLSSKQISVISSKNVRLKGFLNPLNKATVLSNADILVHVEGLSLKDELEVRQSFSTKLVDYMSIGKAILAVGPASVASIRTLEEQNVGLRAHSRKEVVQLLSSIIEDKTIITESTERSIRAIEEYYNIDHIQEKLKEELECVINKSEK